MSRSSSAGAVRARFLGSFTTALPAPSMPEVAFAGRSNVGKSSAINLLLGVPGIARVAKTPGRTQALNLFVVEERWIAVDLPGYGYAKVSKKLQESWKGYIEDYLGARSTLKLVVILVDGRHEAMDMDSQLIHAMRGAGIPVLLLATKIDGISRTRRAAALSKLAEGHGLPVEVLVGFSSTEDIGREDALRAISRAIAQ